MVIAHVLVHREGDARSFASTYGFESFRVVHPQRLLSEDSFEGVTGASGFDQAELRIGRHGNIQHFDGRVCEQLFAVVVNLGNVVALSDLRGALVIARGDGD